MSRRRVHEPMGHALFSLGQQCRAPTLEDNDFPQFADDVMHISHVHFDWVWAMFCDSVKSRGSRRVCKLFGGLCAYEISPDGTFWLQEQNGQHFLGAHPGHCRVDP